MTYPLTRVATIWDVFEVDPERKGGDFRHFEGVFWSPWQDEKQAVINMPNPSLNYPMASRFMGNMKHVGRLTDLLTAYFSASSPNSVSHCVNQTTWW